MLKPLRLMLAALCMLVSAPALSWGNWAPHPYDKASHVAAATALAPTLYHIFKNRMGWKPLPARVAAGSITFLTIGIAKEMTDKNFDYQDLAASAAGTVAGVGVTFTF